MIQTKAVETMAIGHWKGNFIFQQMDIQQTIMIPLEFVVQSIPGIISN
jgi:thioredoxin-like negative regulator of GroEL